MKPFAKLTASAAFAMAAVFTSNAIADEIVEQFGDEAKKVCAQVTTINTALKCWDSANRLFEYGNMNLGFIKENFMTRSELRALDTKLADLSSSDNCQTSLKSLDELNKILTFHSTLDYDAPLPLRLHKPLSTLFISSGQCKLSYALELNTYLDYIRPAGNAVSRYANFNRVGALALSEGVKAMNSLFTNPKNALTNANAPSP